MNILYLAAAILAASGGGIDVHLAPDQPIPIVYADEPLIVEFTSDTPVTFDAKIAITGGNAPEYRAVFEDLQIRGSGQYWAALDDFPNDRGRFTADISILTEDGEINSTHEFCRVGRPFAESSAPVGMEMQRFDPDQLQALLGLPLRVARQHLADPAFDRHLEAADEAGLRVALAVDLAAISENALEQAAARYGDRVSHWELDAHGDSEALLSATEALRRGGVRSGMALIVDNVDAVDAALRDGGGRHLRGLAIKEDSNGGATPADYRRAAEEAGYEGLRLTVVTAPPQASQGEDSDAEEEGTNAEEDDAFDAGPALVRRLVRHAAAGAAFTHLHASALVDHGGFFPGYAHLSGFVHQFQDARYIGQLPQNGIDAHVFRTDDRWLVALWSDNEAGDVTLDTGDVSNLRFTDALNNELTTPAIDDGVATLRVDSAPRFLRGRGGDVLHRAAAWTAQREAQALLDKEALQDRLSEELRELIEAIAQQTEYELERLEFFTLLRAFPYIEEQWSIGNLPRSTAARATANLHRLSRALCVLEEESGEAFIEPLQDLLAKAGEYQSVYLTSVGNQSQTRARSNWLLQEISRLTEEARSLDEKGRTIEAAAVAALAEWRARSLEHTMFDDIDEEEEEEEEADT